MRHEVVSREQLGTPELGSPELGVSITGSQSLAGNPLLKGSALRLD